ncbi:MAG: M24 family metallopeptidase [Fibrobacter sp.]|nr:M24 family metallopeptidase [Fibrobacter sp.]
MSQSLQLHYSQVFLTSDCGVNGAEIYAKRRREFLQKLEHPCLIAGVRQAPGSSEAWYNQLERRVQNPQMLFLTGINQTQVYLWLDPRAEKNAQEILFLPKVDPHHEFWEGARLGLYEKDSPQAQAHLQKLQALLGFNRMENSQDLWELLENELLDTPTASLYSFWEGNDETPPRLTSLYFRKFRSELQSFLDEISGEIELKNCHDLYYQSVLPLDSQRQSSVKEASAKTARAFNKLLQKLPDFETENQLRGYLDYLLHSESPDGLAFSTIVAGGANAEVLHYQKSDESLKDGELVPLDFGLRWGSVCTDISRTLPINGKFDPLQKILYQIVLDTQEYFENSVRGGILLKDLNEKAWNYLEALLEERFLALGGQAERLYPLRKQSFVAPHGISHALGVEVHEGDILRTYQQKPLNSGMIISNEPGLYGKFTINIDGTVYSQRLGIRIEDDLLITDSGCENLTRAMSKSIEALEMQINHAKDI